MSNIRKNTLKLRLGNGSSIIGTKLSGKNGAFGVTSDFLFNEYGQKIYDNDELFSLLNKQYPISPNELINVVDNVNKFCRTYGDFNAFQLTSEIIQNALAKKIDVDDLFWEFANNHR